MKYKPLEFVRQVRQEVGRVVWPTRKETLTTTWVVGIICFLSAIFFIVIDRLVLTVIKYLLNLGV